MSETRPKITRRKITEWVSDGPYAVAVEIEAQFLPNQPDVALLAPDTVRFLEKVADDARKGDLEALRKVGKVYVEMHDGLATVSS